MEWTLVTGGAKGLGAEICRRLAKKGGNVLVHFRSSEDEVEQVVEACKKGGGNAQAVQGEFSSREGIEKFLAALSPFLSSIRFLINNVGEYDVAPFAITTDSLVYEMFHANAIAPMLITKALLPSLIHTKGRIVNIGTAGLNRQSADAHAPVYMAGKRALLSFTKSLAKELAPYRVNVNMVSPGFMENSIGLPEDLSTLPFGRAASLEEVAKLVTLLLGEDASYITGQNIEITGAVRL
jgi:NAD(P)-dependent dehydrogenase (short-subunit alcohol dehydrogenase family)